MQEKAGDCARTQALDGDELRRLDAWWRAANYLSVGQNYLMDNPLLRGALRPPRSKTAHPHGISNADFGGLFTTSQPVIFAFHGYPWLIHRLTYNRTNHDNITSAGTSRKAPRRPRSTWPCSTGSIAFTSRWT